MDDGAKKAGGVFAALLVGIGAFAARGLDDCARVGSGAARYGDDVAFAGAGGAAGADDFARFGRGAAYGEGVAGSGDDLGRFAGGGYGDDLAQLADEPGSLVDDLAGESPSLSDDALESAAELALDVGVDAAELALEEEDDDASAIPVLREDARAIVPERVRVIALGSRAIRSADVTIDSLASLEAALARGDAAALAIMVLPPEPVRGRSDAAVLVRAAQLGRRAILMVCAPEESEPWLCMERAALMARRAAVEGTDGLFTRLEAQRDESPWGRDVTLHRLHQGPGDAQPRLASSPL